MPSLPPCDLTRRCCKCGSDNIHTRWLKAAPFANTKIAITAAARQRLLNDRLAFEEHLVRHCRVCSYRWPEAPLDQCSAIDQLAAKARVED